MLSIPESFLLEDRKTRDLVRDLHDAKPRIFWTDLLVTAGIGWAALGAATALPLFSAAMLASFVIAIFALYRGLCFIHELSHQGKRSIPYFEAAWNWLFGFPLLIPSSAYVGMHQGHHSLSTYGTVADPEYLPFARSAGMTILFALESFALPALFVIRFLVLAPFGFLIPRFYRWLVVHLSSLTMNVAYRRAYSEDLLRTIQAQNAGILLVWGILFSLAFMGRLPWRFFLVWFAVSSFMSFINTLRTLGSHAYESEGTPLGREGQLADSIDTPGALWTELWAPVGLRYHALHHYFPGIPYHNLPTAWQRLSAELGDGAFYHRMRSPSLLHSLAALYRKGRRFNALRNR